MVPDGSTPEHAASNTVKAETAAMRPGKRGASQVVSPVSKGALEAVREMERDPFVVEELDAALGRQQ
jgi:hypothetical protein